MLGHDHAFMNILFYLDESIANVTKSGLHVNAISTMQQRSFDSHQSFS
jgi:hypothetical protein